MPTTNLVTKSLGKIEYGSGSGIPDHVAPKGSFYIDVDTDKIYINSDGTSTGWTSVLKNTVGEFYMNSNTTISLTATNSWVGISGTATASSFSSNLFTISTQSSPILSSTGQGGFESTVTTGTQGFVDNGWVVVNGAQVNKWYVGTTGASGSGFGAYISNTNGSTNTYATTSISTVYFYRDITIPAYSTRLNLSFSARVTGESVGATKYDYLRVYSIPTSQTLTAGTLLAGGLGDFNNLTGYPTQNLTFGVSPSISTQSRRIAFGWTNDGGAAGQPPASVDNISITADFPLNFTYIGSQSTFRSLLTGSLQSTGPISSVGVQIVKNTGTVSNQSESTINLGTNFKDSFSTQNVFTMSDGDVIRPFINNKVSNAAVLCPNLFLGIWEID